MKLRPLVTSLMVAGLISSPLMATAKNLHQHHKHRGVKTTRPLMGNFGAQAALVSQNNAMSPVPSFDWTKRIHLSGYANFDAKYGSRGPLGIVPQFKMSDDSHELNVNNANVFIDAHINHYVNTHVGFAYVSDSVHLFDLGLNTLSNFTPITKSLRSDKGSVFAGGEVSVDEAYVSIRDFAQTPVYFRAGKMYAPFGTYSNPYPITYSLTQLLSQTRATEAEFGFVSSYGVYGVAYILDGAQSTQNFADEKFDDGGKINQHIPYTRINNYGFKTGWNGCFHNMDIHLNTAFIKDIRDVSFLADIQDIFAYTYSTNNGNIAAPNGFGMTSSGGVSVHGDLTYRNIDMEVNYVTAIRNVIRENGANQNLTDTRIWAADVSGTYQCETWGYNTALAMSYQFSRQAGGVMPKWRYQGDVSVELFHNTNLTFEFRHDQDYEKVADDRFSDFLNSVSCAGNVDNQVTGGTGHSANQATLRLGVVF